MVKGNITREVKNYLAKDLSLQKSLQKEVINLRALAKHIIKEQGLKTSTDTVINAIRKVSHTDKTFKSESEKVEDVLKLSSITTRDGIICLVLRNQSDIQKYLSEITKTIDMGKSPRMIKGRNNLKIMTNKENLQKIRTIFPELEKFEKKENLSEIMLKTSLKADETKGILARISNELILYDINISEIILCIPEIIIYVDQKDLLTAHQSMLNLCQTINEK